MKKITIFLMCLSICSTLCAETTKEYKYSKTPEKEVREIMQIWARVLKGETVSPEDAKRIEASFKQKISEHPDDLRGYEALGLLYERTGQLDKALDSYKKYFGEKINSANAYDFLGQFFARNKKTDLAIQYFEKAVKLEPNNATFMSNLAGPYLETKQFTKAIEIYKKAMQMEPNNEMYHLRLANAYMMSGKENEAIIECEEILKNKPGQKQAEAMLNHLYAKLGKGDVHPLTTAGKIKESMKEQGYHASVRQAGNTIISTPTYYETGKAPITDFEKIVFAEYGKRIKEATSDLPVGQDKQKVVNTIAHEIAQKYNMTDENFTYMILKIEFNEVVPDTYVPPSEKPIEFKDVNKDKYEDMTPAERAAVVKSWNAETDFEKLQQRGLTAEASGDFKNAAVLYKEILASKEIQDDTVPMMHCALQRCYEKLSDANNEKLELVWVNDNILAADGKYNRMAQYLTNAVKNHLRERMARFGIKPN
jgi:tetratricopeptide (TPR) repeat protein